MKIFISHCSNMKSIHRFIPSLKLILNKNNKIRYFEKIHKTYKGFLLGSQ